MFKFIDVNVTIGKVPIWVWGAAIILVAFFGTIYLVPEAKTTVGQFVARYAPLQKGGSTSNITADGECGPFKLQKSVKHKDGTVTYICN